MFAIVSCVDASVDVHYSCMYRVRRFDLGMSRHEVEAALAVYAESRTPVGAVGVSVPGEAAAGSACKSR